MWFKKLFKKVEKAVFVAKVSKAITECPAETISDSWIKLFVVGIGQYQDILNSVYKTIKLNAEPIAIILYNLNEIAKDKTLKQMLKTHKESFKEKADEVLKEVTKAVDFYKDILAEEGLTKKRVPKPGSVCEKCGTDNIYITVSHKPKESIYCYKCSNCGHLYTAKHVID